MKKVLRIHLFIFALLYCFYDAPGFCFFPTTGKAPQEAVDQFIPEGKDVKEEVWVQGLEIPWSLLFMPDGRALISERPGRIRLVKDGRLRESPYAVLEVAAVGEGGLMGLARHPEFSQKPFIYAMHTYGKGGDLFNRVIRMKDLGEKGIFDKVILDRIPGGRFHNGGRIAFGPDGLIYITAGETFKSGLAQDLNSLGGKILRVTPEGGIPPDNPFAGSPIYSYGHRNPQGLAWHPETGDLFESEHGPSGEFLIFGHDEINVIRKGGNYGWPRVVGAPGMASYIDPLVVWKKATPPSGITFYRSKYISHLQDSLFVATLRSKALIRIGMKKEKERYRISNVERWFTRDDGESQYGRLRDVVEGPEGAIYFLTSNRDGRGRPLAGDDKIYRVLPR